MATSEVNSERPPGHGKVSRQIAEPQANLQTVGRSDKLTLQFAPSRPLTFIAILHTSLARLAFTDLCQHPTRPHILFSSGVRFAHDLKKKNIFLRAPILPVQS